MNGNTLRKGAILRPLLFILPAACVGIVAWLIATGGCADPTADTVDAGGGDAKATSGVEIADDDVELQLDGQNTGIKWTGSNLKGDTPSGYFYELSGDVVVDGESKLKHIEITIEMDSVKSTAESLTKKLKHKGFFEVDKFPEAKFVATSITDEMREGDPSGTSFVVEGNFQLRDVTRSITIPMTLEAGENTMQLTSEFKINRKDYGVAYSNTVGDALIRDDVLIEISIKSKVSNIEKTIAARVTNQPHENYTDTIKETLVEFDMIAVPGDESKGIKPFFIGKNEVTWNEFDYWALCQDMSTKEAFVEIEKQLRPSSPHDIEAIYRDWGRDNQPVVGVSRLAAELYCDWLSTQTGRTYRLPTTEEWEYTYERGGGALDEVLESEELLKRAWFEKNGVSTDDEGFDHRRAMPVGTLEPNEMGINDMLGNAAEWVADDQPVVRGGHFKLSAEELTGSHHEAEDQKVWNKDYPQGGDSKWWYVNADYVGFRIVCELE